MLETRAFYDLCILESCLSQEKLEKTIKLLYDYGYRTIAVNQSIEDGNIESKKKKKKGASRDTGDIVPLPYNLAKINEIVSNLNLENFRAFNRLTITFSNREVLHKITKSVNYKKYHIIAALPTTLQALMFVCSHFEADILTFNPENKFSLKLSRKLYGQLLDRGYHIELLYSPAIEDSTKRKNLIHAAHLYHSFGKSKNIIFSSGAQDPIYFRNPYDIINLGFIFGLSEMNCKEAITHYPNKVIINSVGRRNGKAIMFVENMKNQAQEITLDDSDEEDIVMDQPASKKSKI